MIPMTKPYKSGLGMPDFQLDAFVSALDRAELDDDPVIYLKAVCVTLQFLGYGLEWINEVFRPKFEAYYHMGQEG